MRTKTINELQEIPIFDLNFSAFLLMNGVVPHYIRQGTKILCLFLPDDKFYHYSSLYHANIEIPVLDFVKALRHLRSKIMTLRDEGTIGGGSSGAK